MGLRPACSRVILNDNTPLANLLEPVGSHNLWLLSTSYILGNSTLDASEKASAATGNRVPGDCERRTPLKAAVGGNSI